MSVLDLLNEALTPEVCEALLNQSKASVEATMIAVATALGPYLDSILDNQLQATKRMWATVRPFLDAMDREVRSLDPKAAQLGKAFEEAGLWVAPSLDLVAFKAIAGLDDESPLTAADLKRILLTYYRNDDCAALRTAVDNWEGTPFFVERMTIIQDALWAHALEKYTLSIPCLLNQAEGLVLSLAKELQRTKGGRKDQALAVIDSTYGDLWSPVAKDIVRAYLSDVVFDNSGFSKWLKGLRRKGLTGFEVLHRDTIMHGVQTDYASEENSLRAFLLLDVLWGCSFTLSF